MIPLIAVIIMAIVTYIPRVLPITIFRKEIKSSFLKSFLYYMPYAVLGAMTFPDIFSSALYVPAAICGTLAALILAFFERSLLEVAVGACVAVYIVQTIFM